MTGPNFRDFAAGKPISAGTLNSVLEWVKRFSRLTVEAPLELHDDGTGPKIRVTIPDGVKVAVLSGALTNAAVGTAPTSQTATMYAFDGSNLNSLGTTDTVYNDHDKTFASGSQIKVAKIDGYWFVIDVRSCASLS